MPHRDRDGPGGHARQVDIARRIGLRGERAGGDVEERGHLVVNVAAERDRAGAIEPNRTILFARIELELEPLGWGERIDLVPHRIEVGKRDVGVDRDHRQERRELDVLLAHGIARADARARRVAAAQPYHHDGVGDRLAVRVAHRDADPRERRWRRCTEQQRERQKGGLAHNRAILACARKQMLQRWTLSASCTCVWSWSGVRPTNARASLRLSMCKVSNSTDRCWPNSRRAAAVSAQPRSDQSGPSSEPRLVVPNASARSDAEPRAKLRVAITYPERNRVSTHNRPFSAKPISVRPAIACARTCQSPRLSTLPSVWNRVRQPHCSIGVTASGLPRLS